MISERLKAIILKELGLTDFPFTEETKAFEVPGWDSLSHMRIIAAVEKNYQVRFRNVEIIRLKSVNELQMLIDSKLS